MDKKIILTLLICTVTFLIGCQSTPENNLKKELTLDFDVQYIRTDGYVDGASYPMITVINSAQELNEYYAINRDTYDLDKKEKVYSDTTIGFLDAVDKYDDAYFKDNILVLVLLEEGSGSIRHKVSDVKRNDNNIEIGIKRIVPEIGTSDMAEWHIMVELKREAYNDADINVIFE